MLGLGIENYALIKFLLRQKINCEITVCDARGAKELGKRYKELTRLSAIFPRKSASSPYKSALKWQLGKNYNKDLDKFDILFRSPGWPYPPYTSLNKEDRERIISSPMKLFFRLCPTKNIIGVTGTKGKGTTASLIYAILKQNFKNAATNGAHANKIKRNVWLGGNIGVAPFEFLSKIKKNDWVVLEMSSFQLEDMKTSPRIAVITNFYKEHLSPADPNNPNYHKTLKDYREAKMNILRWQKKGDYALLNSNFQFPKNKRKIIYFTKSNLKSKLIGEHNKENVAAAVAAAKIAGIKDVIIKKAVANFKGLEHRLEFVVSKHNLKYYNDSFATTPESAITALKSFSAPIILLAGGADKGSGFRALAEEIKKRVKFVVLFAGKATPRLKKELLKIKCPADKMRLVHSMVEAIKLARNRAEADDIVLLSPACASFGIFKNYKERGKQFKLEVKK